MEIYVEGELPDNCKTCQYKTIGRCVLSDKNVFDYMVYETSPKDCPIKPLSIALAEERKKVVQEIREWCKENFDYKKLPNELGCWVAVNREEFFDILDQIERGE